MESDIDQELTSPASLIDEPSSSNNDTEQFNTDDEASSYGAHNDHHYSSDSALMSESSSTYFNAELVFDDHTTTNSEGLNLDIQQVHDYDVTSSESASDHDGVGRRADENVIADNAVISEHPEQDRYSQSTTSSEQRQQESRAANLLICDMDDRSEPTNNTGNEVSTYHSSSVSHSSSGSSTHPPEETTLTDKLTRHASLSVDEIGNTELHILVIYDQCDDVRQLKDGLDTETWRQLLSTENRYSKTPRDLCRSDEMFEQLSGDRSFVHSIEDRSPYTSLFCGDLGYAQRLVLDDDLESMQGQLRTRSISNQHDFLRGKTESSKSLMQLARSWKMKLVLSDSALAPEISYQEYKLLHLMDLSEKEDNSYIHQLTERDNIGKMADLLVGVSDQVLIDVCNLRDTQDRSVLSLTQSNNMRYLLLTGDTLDVERVSQADVDLLNELGKDVQQKPESMLKLMLNCNNVKVLRSVLFIGDQSGETMFSRLIKTGFGTDMLKRKLELARRSGQSVDLLEADENGNTLIHRTAMYDDIGVMTILIHGMRADDRELLMSVVNNNGRTPIDLAQSAEMRYLMVTGALLYDSSSMRYFFGYHRFLQPIRYLLYATLASMTTSLLAFQVYVSVTLCVTLKGFMNADHIAACIRCLTVLVWSGELASKEPASTLFSLPGCELKQ